MRKQTPKKNPNQRPPVRRAQLITTFGPGSIVDIPLFPSSKAPIESLMPCSIENWGATKGTVINDSRLEKRLRKSHFRMPPSETDDPCGIPAVLFPEWWFCKQCGEIRHISKWKEKFKSEEHDYFSLKCFRCFNKLISSRFVLICPDGHIDDFPWIRWAHRNKTDIKRECVESESLGFTISDNLSGLEGIKVSCKVCNSFNSMSNCFNRQENNFPCSGNHPHAPYTEQDRNCDRQCITAQRGGSNIYFPITVSSIYIPDFEDTLVNKIYESRTWSFLSTQSGTDINTKISLLQNELKDSSEKIREALLKIENKSDVADDEAEYRYHEYLALKGNYSPEKTSSKDFHTDVINGNKYNIKGISNIVLVHRLKETRALSGFTRVRPRETDDLFDDEDDIEVGTVPISLDRSTDWLPAIEVRGEGIFIEFDNATLRNWAQQNRVTRHTQQIIERTNRDGLSPEFILLHSLAHSLIRQLSFECGYSSSSLRERIYCSEEDKFLMNAILIYTAEGDSDGTLGGLVRQGQPDRFIKTFYDAIYSASWCSSDPLCIGSHGQGYNGRNLGACHACLLLPETSCESRNVFLDRGVMMGKETGFFSYILDE